MSGSCPGSNFLLGGNNKKPQTRIEVEKVPEVSSLILSILREDLKYWKDKNLIQPGMERNILICKISKDIKVNSNVIDIALQDLELEQKIIQIYDGKFNRYIVGFNLD